MENYKGNFISPGSFEAKTIETDIPSDIVNAIIGALQRLDDSFLISPAMINPKDLSINFGAVNKKDNKIKHTITINISSSKKQKQ